MPQARRIPNLGTQEGLRYHIPQLSSNEEKDEERGEDKKKIPIPAPNMAVFKPS